MAHYHPANELLMAFAAGQLTNALGIMIACHLETCPKCRQQVRLFEQLGGELVSNEPSIEVSDHMLPRLLQALDQPTPAEPSQPGDIRLPRPLRRFVPAYFDQLPWKGFTASIQEYLLPFSDDQFTAKLYKIAANTKIPKHTHGGREFTLVMEGSFSDHAGDYVAGDFVLANQQTIHQPTAASDSDCICFAVLDAPLKMTGFFGRLINPFLR